MRLRLTRQPVLLLKQSSQQRRRQLALLWLLPTDNPDPAGSNCLEIRHQGI